jgi:Flp pilus assembly protein TadG
MQSGKKGFLTKLAKFRRDHRGISVVEFAFVFPVMVALYLGGTAATQGITIKRKLTLTTRTVGDLVSQDTNVSNVEMTTIFGAATVVLEPYPGPIGTLAVTVSSVNIDQNGNATVLWSDTYQGTARTVGSAVTLPTGMNIASTTLIMSEGSYLYVPPVGSAFFPSITLKDTLYFRPRRVNSITRSVT